MPHIVQVLSLDGWVLDTGWVTSSDEVGDSSINTGRGVPEDLSWTGVVHWGWPDGEDNVLRWEGSVLDEGSVLSHSVVKWDIIILAPSTEWVKKEDWVLVSELDELLSGVLKEEHVSIMKWVSHLEGIDGISALLLDLLLDLLWGKSPLVISIVEDNSLGESHALTRDEPISLGHKDLSLWMLWGEGTEGTGADLFLSVLEEDWLLNDSEDIIATKGSASEGNS